MLADTGKTVDWMVSNGIEFDATPYSASSRYPMALANGGGAGLINMLVDACEEKGIELMLNTKGTSLITDDTGAVVGIDAEIAAAIAEKLGLELEILDMDFDGALAAPQSGKSDIVMAGVTVNEERQLVLDFSNTYANGVQKVIVAEGSDITMENLGEQQIGTQKGTTGNILTTDEFGEDHVIAYDDAIAAVQALNNGQIDCVVIDSAVADNLVEANPGLTTLDTDYANEEYAIGVAKGNTALLDAINTALNELISDGTVQTIIDKYITAE